MSQKGSKHGQGHGKSAPPPITWSQGEDGYWYSSANPTEPQYVHENGEYRRVYNRRHGQYWHYTDTARVHPYFQASDNRYYPVYTQDATYPDYYNSALDPGTLYFFGSDGRYHPRLVPIGANVMQAGHLAMFQNYLERHNNTFTNSEGQLVEFDRVTVTEGLHTSTAMTDPFIRNGNAEPHYGIILTNDILQQNDGSSHLLHYRPANENNSFFYPNAMTREQVRAFQSQRYAWRHKADKKDKDPKGPSGGGSGAAAGNTSGRNSGSGRRYGGQSSRSGGKHQSKGHGQGQQYQYQSFAMPLAVHTWQPLSPMMHAPSMTTTMATTPMIALRRATTMLTGALFIIMGTVITSVTEKITPIPLLLMR